MIKPSCTYSLDQVRESGLIPAARMIEVVAEIESRIEKCYDAQKREIDNCALAVFPSGKRWIYPRMDHDPKGDFIRRELLGEVLTETELKLINDRCHVSWSENAEAKRFETATKLDSWDGWVTNDDDYWESVEDYLDMEGDDDPPEYLWVAEPQEVIPSLDVGDVVEHWISDRGWEEMETDDLNGVKELQAALDAFVEMNKGVVSYRPDYKRCVLLASYLSSTTD